MRSSKNLDSRGIISVDQSPTITIRTIKMSKTTKANSLKTAITNSIFKGGFKRHTSKVS